MAEVPDWDDLPAVEGLPQGCAWGLWDKDGKKDVYGTLNLLTQEVVRGAFTEATDGMSISLNWPLGAIKSPGFGRIALTHKVIDFLDTPVNCHGYDDEVAFNTQTSSQWDSLCHFHHQETGLIYNGVKPSVKDLTQNFGDEDKEQKFPTINHWHDRGGLVARGILIDYKAYADAHGIKINPFSNEKIMIEDLEKIATYQGVDFKYGDVLLIRSGFTEALGAMTGEEQVQAMASYEACGVEGTEKAAKWIWNKHFSAVAGDMIAFEHIPPIINGEEGRGGVDLVLHSYLIALMGMPIGELWDLKALSDHCSKIKRYSFLLTSIPLNVPGGIASPPNAIAIF